MKAGIKYCGGCNPRFDRGELVKRLAEALGDKYEFEAAREEMLYDVIVVICGCSSGCADYKKLRAKSPIIFITMENDYAAAYEKLLQL